MTQDNHTLPSTATSESVPNDCPQNFGPNFDELSDEAFSDLYADSVLCRTARIENTDVGCGTTPPDPRTCPFADVHFGSAAWNEDEESRPHEGPMPD